MTYAEARQLLIDMAAELQKPYLTVARRAEMSRMLLVIEKRVARRKAIKRAEPRAKSIADPAVRAEIKRLARLYPDLPNRDVGKMAGVDGGRITDITRGKRT